MITPNFIKENVKIACMLHNILKHFFVKIVDFGFEQQNIIFKAETTPATNRCQKIDHKFKNKENINV